MVRKKLQVMHENEQVRAHVPGDATWDTNQGEIRSGGYSLVGADLRDTADVEAALKRAGFDPEVRRHASGGGGLCGVAGMCISCWRRLGIDRVCMAASTAFAVPCFLSCLPPLLPCRAASHPLIKNSLLQLPTLVLAECVLVYMDLSASNPLVR